MGKENLEVITGIGIIQEFDKGAYLCFQEDSGNSFFVIIRGKVRIHRVGLDGREQILKFAGSGDVFGEAAMFANESYPATAIAEEKVRVFFIFRDKFIKMGREHPDILLRLLGIMSHHLLNFVKLIDDLSLKEVPARLARRLLELQKTSQTNVVEIGITRTLLAAHLGTIPETLSRILKKMQQRNLIETDKRKIHLLDLEKLRDLAEGGKL
jgi:CRP/FNR family transcriptional regulator